MVSTITFLWAANLVIKVSVICAHCAVMGKIVLKSILKIENKIVLKTILKILLQKYFLRVF